ncbi:MAG TPA: hypothetical protein VK217_13490, partial [Acidimicrobiales bacterium]|nr:hypothetical protein [Acidimicrobiales bacterium]
MAIRRPRATHTGGGEVNLDSYKAFSSTDLMTEIAVERMLAGVATRRHGLVSEPLGHELEALAKGDPRSALSRRFCLGHLGPTRRVVKRGPVGSRFRRSY